MFVSLRIMEIVETSLLDAPTAMFSEFHPSAEATMSRWLRVLLLIAILDAATAQETRPPANGCVGDDCTTGAARASCFRDDCPAPTTPCQRYDCPASCQRDDCNSGSSGRTAGRCLWELGSPRRYSVYGRFSTCPVHKSVCSRTLP